MNISFCTVVLSLIQGIALNTDVPPCSQGWGVTRSWRSQDWRGGQGPLEIIEGIISALGPNKMVRLLHQLVQRHGLLPEPTDELAERD
jgi:hypothetical protein